MYDDCVESLEQLVFTKMRGFSRARKFDVYVSELQERGLDVTTDGFCVANAARLWHTIYNGAHGLVAHGVDLFAYHLANQTVNDYVEKQFVALGRVLRSVGHGEALDARNDLRGG